MKTSTRRIILAAPLLLLSSALVTRGIGQSAEANAAADLQIIVEGILAAAAGADLVCLGEDHGSRNDSELRIAVLQHPEFARRADVIVVEFADIAHQPVLDRLIVDGEDLTRDELSKVWRSANGADVWESPIYEAFLRAVRNVNLRLPRNDRVRVIAGDDPTMTNRGRFIRELVSREVLDKGLKGLAIYGARHCEKRGMGFPGELEDRYPGKIWSAFSFYDVEEGRRVLGLGPKPQLVRITGTQRAKLPVGRMFFTGRLNDPATLGDIADAIVYYGDNKDAKVRPNR